MLRKIAEFLQNEYHKIGVNMNIELYCLLLEAYPVPIILGTIKPDFTGKIVDEIERKINPPIKKKSLPY